MKTSNGALNVTLLAEPVPDLKKLCVPLVNQKDSTKTVCVSTIVVLKVSIETGMLLVPQITIVVSVKSVTTGALFVMVQPTLIVSPVTTVSSYNHLNTTELNVNLNVQSVT